jgi:hypothetical protein
MKLPKIRFPKPARAPRWLARAAGTPCPGDAALLALVLPGDRVPYQVVRAAREGQLLSELLARPLCGFLDGDLSVWWTCRIVAEQEIADATRRRVLHLVPQSVPQEGEV